MTEHDKFPASDYEIVVSAVVKLCPVEMSLITLEFWEGLSIQDIATLFDWPWGEVYARRAVALKKLKEACLANPGMSRCQSDGQSATAA